jgi:hypothetical protein
MRLDGVAEQGVGASRAVKHAVVGSFAKATQPCIWQVRSWAQQEG